MFTVFACRYQLAAAPSTLLLVRLIIGSLGGWQTGIRLQSASLLHLDFAQTPHFDGCQRTGHSSKFWSREPLTLSAVWCWIGYEFVWRDSCHFWELFLRDHRLWAASAGSWMSASTHNNSPHLYSSRPARSFLFFSLHFWYSYVAATIAKYFSADFQKTADSTWPTWFGWIVYWRSEVSAVCVSFWNSNSDSHRTRQSC